MCKVNVFTSSFSQAKGLDRSKYLIVSISRISPKGEYEVECKGLAPSTDLLKAYKENADRRAYVEVFAREVLDMDYIRHQLSALLSITKGRDIVLCCYEARGRFCHRKLIADFVYACTEYPIREIVNGKPLSAYSDSCKTKYNALWQYMFK